MATVGVMTPARSALAVGARDRVFYSGDLVSRGRIHSTYIWGGVLLVVSVPGRLMMSGTGTWRRIAEFLTR
jgi:hypothetical protein